MIYNTLELSKIIWQMEKQKRTHEELPDKLEYVTENYRILGYNEALRDVVQKLAELSQ